MSHVDSGFCVTDIESLNKVVKAQCPNLELVKKESYRTWVADAGSLVGDYPLPWVYHLKMFAMVAKNVGVANLHERAKAVGVELPKDLRELEKNPLTLDQQRKLLQDNEFKKAYQHVSTKVVGKDAEFVIKHKSNRDAYEIGLVKHPLRQGEYVMMADFYMQGRGLLNEEGVGTHKQVGGKDVWGSELKKSYSLVAAEKQIQEQIKAGKYLSYTKTTLPDGRIKLEVTPK